MGSSGRPVGRSTVRQGLSTWEFRENGVGQYTPSRRSLFVACSASAASRNRDSQLAGAIFSANMAILRASSTSRSTFLFGPDRACNSSNMVSPIAADDRVGLDLSDGHCAGVSPGPNDDHSI